MLRQMLKASYTIPPYVSTECRDLIQQILRVNPDQRITIQDILTHPWMERAASLLRQHRMPPPLLPTPQPISLKKMADESARSSHRSEEGIFSPFDPNDRVKVAGQLAIAKCRSAENVARRFARTVPASRKPPTKGEQHIPITTAHQNSLVTIAPIGIKARKRSFGPKPPALLTLMRDEC
jgi:serine/threonine protein kinase